MTSSSEEVNLAEAMASPSTAGAEGAAVPPTDYPPARHAYWALFIFALSLLVNVLDRGIINLLIEPIKRDLHLTDVQVSLLMGFAFVVFYILLGFPIASLADSKSRRLIVSFGLFCWSGMTALCGVAQNFLSFFFCRVGVGVGEACTGPATLSMLADYFPPAKLTRAIAFMSFGGIAGVGLAQIIGAGVIHSLQGVPNLKVPIVGIVRNWQMVFFVVGLPGFLVAALMLTVKEPPRRGRLTSTAAMAKVPWRSVLQFVGKNWQCYFPMFAAMGLNMVVHSGSTAWSIVFFQRTYEWSPVQAGYVLGLTALVTSPIGMLLGAWLTERLAARGYDDANMRVLSWAATLALPWYVLAPLMPSPWLSVAMTAISGVIYSTGSAPMAASLQLVTPNEMRGRVSAIYLFIANVLGTGFGPTAIALLTDLVFKDESQIRYSLALGAFLTVVPAALYWYGRRPYREAIIRAKSWQ